MHLNWTFVGRLDYTSYPCNVQLNPCLKSTANSPGVIFMCVHPSAHSVQSAPSLKPHRISSEAHCFCEDLMHNAHFCLRIVKNPSRKTSWINKGVKMSACKSIHYLLSNPAVKQEVNPFHKTFADIKM